MLSKLFSFFHALRFCSSHFRFPQFDFPPLQTKSHCRKDASAFMCELCRQTFMVNARPPLLYQHVLAKHPAGTELLACFPVQLKDFDPDDPTGEKKAKADKAAEAEAAAKAKRLAKKKADAGLDDLLNAGLTAAKKGLK